MLYLFFNFTMSTMGLFGYLMSSPMYFMNALKIFSSYYFITDSLNEICVHKRYHYIPHHILALVAIVSIQEHLNLNDINLMFFYSEGTSFIINIRLILKEENRLSFKLDLIFFSIYFFGRMIGMSSILYRFYSYKRLFYSGVLIEIMSLFWLYKWYKSILKYKLKKINPNNVPLFLG